jgi:NADP-dependent 3-hydroxy acid dehydrogenase YdfG
MREQKSDHFINVSSVAGYQIHPVGGVYSGTKYAVRAFQKHFVKKNLRSGRKQYPGDNYHQAP